MKQFYSHSLQSDCKTFIVTLLTGFDMSVINSDPKRKNYSDHSSYSYSGLSPKERSLNSQPLFGSCPGFHEAKSGWEFRRLAAWEPRLNVYALLGRCIKRKRFAIPCSMVLTELFSSIPLHSCSRCQSQLNS